VLTAGLLDQHAQIESAVVLRAGRVSPLALHAGVLGRDGDELADRSILAGGGERLVGAPAAAAEHAGDGVSSTL
jgi:hypothetical protein